jgi:hypothetical protein
MAIILYGSRLSPFVGKAHRGLMLKPRETPGACQEEYV